MVSTLRLPHASKRLVIGIAGRMGAGKTSAGKYLAFQHGFHYLRYSQVLTESMSGTAGEQSLQELGWKVMSHGMQKELNRNLLKRMRDRGDYVVDGLRHPIDYRSLKKRFGAKFRLVYIVAPIRLRWRRLKRAGRFDTMKDFEMADRHPVETSIPRLRSKAEAVIRNNRTMSRLQRALDGLLTQMRKGDYP